MGDTIFGTGYTHWYGVLVCCGHFTFTCPPCVTKMQKLPYLPDAVVPLLLHVTSEFYFHTAFPPIFLPFRYQCFKLFLDMFFGYQNKSISCYYLDLHDLSLGKKN